MRNQNYQFQEVKRIISLTKCILYQHCRGRKQEHLFTPAHHRLPPRAWAKWEGFRIGYSDDNYTLSHTGWLRFREGRWAAQGHIFIQPLCFPSCCLLHTPQAQGPNPWILQIIHMVLPIVHLVWVALIWVGEGHWNLHVKSSHSSNDSYHFQKY